MGSWAVQSSIQHFGNSFIFDSRLLIRMEMTPMIKIADHLGAHYSIRMEM